MPKLKGLNFEALFLSIDREIFLVLCFLKKPLYMPILLSFKPKLKPQTLFQ